MKNLKKFVKAAVIIAILAVMTAGVTKVIIPKIQGKITIEASGMLVDTQMYSLDRYKEKLAAQESDIDGWTKLDKYNAGLNPDDGSDTDGDGLTDKEEIEVYGSDPLKSSTSGDLYTDAYKVANGMDLNTYYEYNGDIEFKYNEYPEIIFTATKESDLWAVATKSMIDTVDGYTVYASYYIYNYSGVLSIDVSDIVNSNNIKAGDITVLTCQWYRSDINTLKYTVNGNIITLKDEFAEGDDKVIILAKKKSIFSSFTGAKSTTLSEQELTADGGVFSSFIFASWWGVKPTIYYVPSGNDEYDKENMDALIYEAAYMVNANRDDGKGMQITYDDIKIVTQTQLELKLKEYAVIPWAVKAQPSDDPIAIGQYCSLDMITGVNRHGVATEQFYVGTDSLPFENFGSEVSLGGNCSGIAHLTSLLYNTGTAPTSGSYQETEIGNDYITWNISGDSENRTLTDSGLYDYKTSTFVSEHSDANGILNVNLTDGEQQFVNMIGAYWAETNDILDTDKYAKVWGKSNYSWSLIEGMMDFLDSGKILDASFLIDETSGHTINIVSYKIDEKDSNIVEFEVYDNNFPANVWGKKPINNTLYVQRVSSTYDHEDTFNYYYYPIDGCTYYFSSRKATCDTYAMIVYDENWNILNDIYDEYNPPHSINYY